MNLQPAQDSAIEMRSDTFTLPTKDMFDAMVSLPLGDDVYHEDPTVIELQNRCAEMFGKEKALLVPSGTMANLCAIMAHCPRGSKILVSDESDIFVYEAGGASVCGGVIYHPIKTLENGEFDSRALEAAFPEDWEDPQFALPSMLSIELPHNRMGGALVDLTYLQKMHALCQEKGMAFHLDSARIFNAAIAMNKPVKSLADNVDSLYFCLSKTLCCPVGSVLMGSSDFIKRAYRIRKMLGGGMRQAGILAACGIVALENVVPKLAEDHRRAKEFATALSEIEGIDVFARPETNMVFFQVSKKGWLQQDFLNLAAQNGLNLAELKPGWIRAAIHQNIDDNMIKKAVDIISTLLKSKE